MLVHDGEACEPDFKAHNLEIYGQLVPEDVVLVSADLKRVDQVHFSYINSRIYMFFTTMFSYDYLRRKRNSALITEKCAQ